MSNTRYVVVTFFTFFVSLQVFAQPGTTIELKKPEKYENRTLASEKTPDDKKIKAGKKFYQNTITHYNYYFNAQNIINDIIDKAKQGTRDDYEKLLPYYNYSLDVTSTDNEIDTVIYKCNAGILLHDLRSDWVDDMYFLLGQAYYLRKNFDSAAHVFQYVNYAFAPKDKDFYDIPIGSNESNTDGVFSIATKESRSLPKKIFSTPPRRNENLLWEAKNFIEMGNVAEGAAVLEMLRYDPNFPERLRPDLEESLGYVFYMSQRYDSAADHLTKSIKIADDRQDEARREYLAAQLYALAGDNVNAEKYFTRSAEHTLDPLMAVYASIQSIQASGADSLSKPQMRINELMRLAHKEKFYNYRDIIYYTAAKAELEIGNNENAYTDLKKSIGYSNNNPVQKSRSFMLLGDLDYGKSSFSPSRKDYDSVEQSSLADSNQQTRLAYRLPPLQKIDDNVSAIHVEDSLQDVAKMPEQQRIAFIRKTVRQLRKAQGLKDEETTPFVNPAVQLAGTGLPGQQQQNADLFASSTDAKGDWYFNNNQVKASGANTFKANFGNRPNIDNWQRIDAVNKQAAQKQAQAQTQQDQPPGSDEPDENAGGGDVDGVDNTLRSPNAANNFGLNANNANSAEITYDALLANVPLTEDMLATSNKKIEDALFENAVSFQNELENYPAAIAAYNQLLDRFPKTEHLKESLFNLSYCCGKVGDGHCVDSARLALSRLDTSGEYTNRLKGKGNPTAAEETAATKTYEGIYDMFISGKFDEALKAKSQADSLFGDKYWTPQLLFIESIYHLSEHQDSLAISTLSSLTQKFSGTPLADRAQRMIDVISKRSEIEDYLTKLQVKRNQDTTESQLITLNPVENVAAGKTVKKNDSIVTQTITAVAKPKVDTALSRPQNVRSYAFNANDQQYVAILLNNVAPVYVGEAKNAFNRYNQMTFYNQKIEGSVQKLNDSLNIVLLGPFADASAALQYVEKSKPMAASRILPWLKPDKYSFLMISPANLDVFKETNDLESYRQLLNSIMPGKF